MQTQEAGLVEAAWPRLPPTSQAAQPLQTRSPEAGLHAATGPETRGPSGKTTRNPETKPW